MRGCQRLAGTGGSGTAYYRDGISRVTTQANDPPGTADDFPFGLSWNPANEIVSRTNNNDGYVFTGHANGSTSYTSNGRNQITAAGGTSLSYNGNGNLVDDGTHVYGYDVENKLINVYTGGATTASLTYDPLGRLYQVSGASGTTKFLYDGADVIAEYDGANLLKKRYVHGQEPDEIAATYSCTSLGLTCRTYPQYNERGSVISLINADGSLSAINRYDEYGNPQGGSVAGRFGYTGQMWLPEVGAYHYKARMYSPALGRFMQTDPIGYAGGVNLYAYAGNNPVNEVDPLGLDAIVITAPAPCRSDCDRSLEFGTASSGTSGNSGWGFDQTTLFDRDVAVSPVLRPGPIPFSRAVTCNAGGCDVGGITITAARRDMPFMLIAPVIRTIGDALDSFADAHLRPPNGRQAGETQGQCYRRIAGASPALGIVRLGSIGAGGAYLGYPRIPLAGGGAGTSLISKAARGSFGFQSFSGLFGTGSIGGAIGRGLSKVSVLGGAAATGFAGGTAVGALERCH